MTHTVKNLPAAQATCRVPGFDRWVEEIPWRKTWQPTPVFLPGEFHEQGSLVGYSPWGPKESDVIERLRTAQHRAHEDGTLIQCNYCHYKKRKTHWGWQRKSQVRAQQEGSCLQPRREASGETTPADTLILNWRS